MIWTYIEWTGWKKSVVFQNLCFADRWQCGAWQTRSQWQSATTCCTNCPRLSSPVSWSRLRTRRCWDYSVRTKELCRNGSRLNKEWIVCEKLPKNWLNFEFHLLMLSQIRELEVWVSDKVVIETLLGKRVQWSCYLVLALKKGIYFYKSNQE